MNLFLIFKFSLPFLGAFSRTEFSYDDVHLVSRRNQKVKAGVRWENVYIFKTLQFGKFKVNDEQLSFKYLILSMINASQSCLRECISWPSAWFFRGLSSFLWKVQLFLYFHHKYCPLFWLKCPLFPKYCCFTLDKMDSSGNQKKIFVLYVSKKISGHPKNVRLLFLEM